MKRRELILASMGVAGIVIPGLARAAIPCPPPQVNLSGGSSASTACPTGPSSLSYSTNFAGVENPLSEGGAWTNVGLDWTNVRKVNGVAKPTVVTNDYNDNYAHLSGFPPNVEVTATVYATGAPPRGEIELLLRWADSPHVARGYECLLDGTGGSVDIVRWNGRRGDFTSIGGNSFAPGSLTTGDVIKARIIGNHIWFYWIRGGTGTPLLICEAIDSTWSDGNPGIAFYCTTGESVDNVGLSSFTAIAI